ncbi:MAG: hypothetical protein MJE77_31990 [Proteobacteria bacterium]|nr:hypothetical protein [Pseudomonadota bacterium]
MRLTLRGFTVLSLAALLGTAACGDDGGSDADASPQTDAAVDAQPPATRVGTIAVLDTEVFINDGTSVAAGPAISVVYEDLSAALPPPAVGMEDGPLGSCVVHVFDLTKSPPDKERPTTDEDAVAVKVNNGTVDTLDVTCGYNDAEKVYVCPDGMGAIDANSVAVSNDGGDGTNNTVTITLANANGPFELDIVGKHIAVIGFPNALYNGTFPVVARGGAKSITVFNPAANGQVLDTMGTGGGYTILAGAGPVPGVTPANVSLLGNDAYVVTIAKAASDEVAAFSKTLNPSGDGLTLANGSPNVYGLPTDAANALTFDCSGTNGGSCGPNGGAISGFVLSGETTDGDITAAGVGPTDMPDPVSKYATFQCTGVPNTTSVTLTQEVLDAVLNTDPKPTRIETRLSRITADLTAPATTIVVGHSMVGYTDVPQTQ